MANSQMVIKNVRFAYVHLFEKDDLMGKYSVRILIPKNTPQLAEIQAAIQAACLAGADKLKGLTVAWTDILHDGDAKLTQKNEPLHPGHYYLNAKSNSQPGVVKVNTTGMGGKTMAITDPTEFYSGCYGWADVNFFAFNQGVNRGISCAINNVLKTGGEDGMGNGPHMGGGKSSAESVFGADLEADDFPE